MKGFLIACFASEMNLKSEMRFIPWVCNAKESNIKNVCNHFQPAFVNVLEKIHLDLPIKSQIYLAA